jgi:GTP diphosphokinase / guanosine-3',5'-bis(diphosphate) 3'-diphosphatase
VTEQGIASPDIDSHADAAAESIPLPPTLPRTDTGPEQPLLRMRQRIARWTAPKAPQHAVLEPLFNVVR